MASTANSLQVTSKSIEAVYREYRQNAYGVNRRYQRKLVWTTQEKERLIDSILREYPLPQFLVAEAGGSSKYRYEIIDGMQRLNAIVAFIENEFALNGQYFDLNSLAVTKQLRDDGELCQQDPVMGRDNSVKITSYEIAQSVYRAGDTNNIEEVFRRINSSGQKLSSQDLRQAGSLSPISELVRDVSSRIRGDHSSSDIVSLSDMKFLSISDSSGQLGISSDHIIWVQHGILNRSGVRSSADEQLVLDIVADMIFDPPLSTGTPSRDLLFQTESASGPEEVVSRVAEELDDPAWALSRKVEIANRFMQVLERIGKIFDEMPNGVQFKKHIGTKGNNPVPRYFEAVFMAVYRLMFCDKKDLSDASLAATFLKDAKPFEDMPSGGGEWPGGKKDRVINALREAMKKAFDIPFSEEHPSRSVNVRMGSSDFSNIVNDMLIESSGRDVKQGFLSLKNGKRSFNDGCFDKIIRTLTAISNTHPSKGGHVIVGIADGQSDADRVVELDEIEVKEYRQFKIVGVEREAAILNYDLEGYYDTLVRKIASHSAVPDKYAKDVASACRLAVWEGHTMVVLFAPKVQDPVKYGDTYYERVGTETKEVLDQIEFARNFFGAGKVD